MSSRLEPIFYLTNNIKPQKEKQRRSNLLVGLKPSIINCPIRELSSILVSETNKMSMFPFTLCERQSVILDYYLI